MSSKHAALLEAARSGDYEQLRPLIPARFSYSFGSFKGPIAYWKFVEKQSGERPIQILARILDMPYTLYRGTYVWPFAYDRTEGDLTTYEAELLKRVPGGQTAIGAEGYLGWRAGIEPGGDWVFFVAGD